jgi:aminomethyltransferase
LVSIDLKELGFFHFTHAPVGGIPCIVSRTGYTGEDGFEILCAWDDTPALWGKLFEVGKPFPLLPCGLGCRDTLRLESRLSLHGNDIDESTNPLEAGLAWITKLEKGDFIGREALLKVKAGGLTRKLVGFELLCPGVPRAHYKAEDQGREIGHVTSGMLSTFLKRSIGLAYLEMPYTALGSEFDVVIRDKRVRAKVVPTPFWKGTAGKKS